MAASLSGPGWDNWSGHDLEHKVNFSGITAVV